MASRFLSRETIFNQDELYRQKMFDKGVNGFVQYNSKFLKYPTPEQLSNIQSVAHIWMQGDSFEKLSFIYYNDSTYWWVIALYNKKPTEQHLSIGDSVFIPLPLFEILSVVG